jgi:PhnB protein
MNERPDFGRLMQGVIPYLAIVDSEKAANFYKAAFGAIQHGETVKSPSGRVMNIGIEVNGGMMMLMDAVMETEFPEEAPADAQGMTLQLVVKDGDFWWDRAVAAGCTVTHPLKREFWGDRYGRLQDPFGLSWALNEPAPGRTPG